MNADRLAEGPRCTHMRVNYDPEEIASEFGPAMSSRWKCSECGLLFVPAPPVDVEALRGEIARLTKGCNDLATQLGIAPREGRHGLDALTLVGAKIRAVLREAGVVKP